MRTIDALAAAFAGLTARGQLRLDGPRLAAEHFNWLVISIPLNRVSAGAGIVGAVPALAGGWTRLRGKLGVRGR